MSFFTVENPFKKPDTSSAGEPGGTALDRLDAPDEAATNNAWFPPVDILDDDSAYQFKADLPGLKASEVRVVRINESLLISGERNLGKGENIIRQERSHGYFCRRFPLPVDASRMEIKAKLSEGVLQITVRKTKTGQVEDEYPERFEIGVRRGVRKTDPD